MGGTKTGKNSQKCGRKSHKPRAFTLSELTMMGAYMKLTIH